MLSVTLFVSDSFAEQSISAHVLTCMVTNRMERLMNPHTTQTATKVVPTRHDNITPTIPREEPEGKPNDEVESEKLPLKQVFFHQIISA